MSRPLLIYALIFFIISGCENKQSFTQIVSPKKDTESITLSVPRISESRPAFIENQPFELGGKCSMEALGGQPWVSLVSVDPTETLVISGWGVDDKRKISPKAIYLRVQDAAAREFYVLAKSLSRADVAAYFNEGYFAQSGYQAEVDIRDLAPATYEAMIVMDVGGKTILCASGRKFVILGASK